QTGAAEREEVKLLGNDLIGLHRGASLTRQDVLTSVDLAVAGALGGAPMGLALTLLGLRAFRAREGADGARGRRAKALGAFKAALAEARRQAGGGEVLAALTQGHKALRTYLGDRLDLQGGALAARDVTERLSGLGLAPEDKERA